MNKTPTVEELEQKISSLNTSLRRYRDLYERSPLPYHSLDKDGNFVDVNPAWLDLLGYKKEEVLGRNYGEFLHPDWKPVFAERFPQFLKMGEVHEVYFKIRRKDGQYVDISLNGCINTDDDGAFLNTNCVFTDISEQIKNRNALEISEKWHRTILQTASSGICTLDNKGDLISVNDSYCEMSGYSHTELLAMNIVDLEANETQEEVRLHIQKIIESGEERFESKHRKKDGMLFNVEISAKHIDIDDGRFVAFISDITERKKAEEELKQYRDNLQALVNEQSLKLQEAQVELLQQERLATLGHLTASVSHELRNPLGTIKSALFSLEDCIELNEISRAGRPIELIERNINRCVNIIEELNTYAKEKELDIAGANLNDWLKATLDEIPIPDDIRTELVLECDVIVNFDQEKLRQVIVNIVNNAVHALQDERSEGKDLQISCRVHNDLYEISVNDNGIGIKEEVKDKIFEPLFSTKGFGLGLGMVIVKNIITQHKGNIHIEGQEGKGTVVTLQLPIDLSEN